MLLFACYNLKIIIIKGSKRMGLFAIPDYWIHPLGCGKNTKLVGAKAKPEDTKPLDHSTDYLLVCDFHKKSEAQLVDSFQAFLYEFT